MAQQNDKMEKAVALDYDPQQPLTPSVLASGRGAVARQILDIAFANGVKVREDADLVEILSHVYRWETDQQAGAPPVGASAP